MALDLTKLSEADLLALKAGDLTKVSEAGLMAMRGGPSAAEQIAADPITKAAQNFNQDASFLENAAAGAGKAVADIGRGAGQLFGIVPQDQVDEAAKRDRPLMKTAGGVAGNVGAQIGMALLPGAAVRTIPKAATAGAMMMAPTATLTGAATGALMGAGMAGLQPVETGSSRAGNMIAGGMAGGAFPLAGMALKGGRAMLQPFYKSGREAIVGNVMNRVAGDQADQVAKALSGAAPIVPGSMPTAGQAGGHAGVAALERSAFATEPTVTQAVAGRMADQNAARVGALQGLAPDRVAADVARSRATAPLAAQVSRSGAQVDVTRVSDLIDNIAAANPKREKLVAALYRVRDTLDMDSPQALKSASQNLGDMLNEKGPTGSRINEAIARELTVVKKALDNQISKAEPAYGQYMQSFAKLSRPINQADIIGEIGERSINPLTGTIKPERFAASITDDVAAKATGFKRAKIAEALEPQQMQTLQAIKDDLARANFAQTAGRGVGSDTVQKMAFNNIMQQTGMHGMPNLLSRPVQVAEYALRSIYGSADKEMRRELAEALLNPQRAATLMQQAQTSPAKAKVAAALRMLTPAAIGGTNAATNQ